MTEAATTLRGLLASPDDDMRFKAAAKVIELALKCREQGELEERLAEVERQLAGEDDPEPAERGAT